MTKILTALTFAIALGLSMATASADDDHGGGYMESGTIASQDPAWPVPNVGYQRK